MPRLIGSVYFTALALLVGMAAEGASIPLRVSAAVMPRVRVAEVQQVATVTVTDLDIQRGFAEVHGATRFTLISNTPSQLEVNGAGAWFGRVQVIGLPGIALDMGSGPSAVAILPAFFQRLRAELTFRFWLTSAAKPGIYAWPLSMSVTPG